MIQAADEPHLNSAIALAIAKDEAQKLTRLSIASHLAVADEAGQFPLHLAAAEGRLQCLELMLQFPSIDVNLYNRQGRTALHLAAFRGHQAIVERLLCVKDIDVDRTTQGNGCTAIYLASCAGAFCIVEALLRAGADPNIKSFTGNTPLAVASFFGAVPVVEALLRGGADTDTVTGTGLTAIEIATAQHHDEVAKRLSLNSSAAAHQTYSATIDTKVTACKPTETEAQGAENEPTHDNPTLIIPLPARDMIDATGCDNKNTLSGPYLSNVECLRIKKQPDAPSPTERHVDSSTNSGSLHSGGAFSDKS